MTVTVRYSCVECGVQNAPVSVRERRPNEDVVYWVEQVCGLQIALDHTQRSPHCTSRKMTDLKIPLPEGGGRLGEATKH